MMMENKQQMYGLTIGLLIGVLGLSVGFILGSGALVHSVPSQRVNSESSNFCEALEDTSERAKKVGALEKSVRTLQKTAGYTPREYLYPALGTYLQHRAKKRIETKLNKRKRKNVRQKRRAALRGSWARKRAIKVNRELLFRMPLGTRNYRLSSGFGIRTLRGKTGFHKGIDLAAPAGTPVIAAQGGKILEAHYLPGYGNTILIAHSARFKTRYAHLQKMVVQVGQQVAAGQLIGAVGSTGKVSRSKWGSSGSHLHFEVYSNGRPVNPSNFLA